MNVDVIDGDQQVVVVTNNNPIQVVAPLISSNAGRVTQGTIPWITATSGIQEVYVVNQVQELGAVTIVSGTSNINIGNLPTVQTVSVPTPINVSQGVPGSSPWPVTVVSGIGVQVTVSGITSVAVNNFPVSQPVTIASGTSNVNIGNFPTVQETFVTNPLVVTAASGTESVHVDNWPTTQSVFVQNQPTIQPITIVSGTSNINVGNFPTIQEVFVTNQIQSTGQVTIASGTSNINVGNFPTVQEVSVQGPITLANTSISGTVTGNILSDQGAAGTSAWPVVIASGVSVSNFPASQVVTITSGSSNVNVGNFPTVQEVFITNPVVSTGLVTSVSGTLNSHIDNFPTVQTVNVNNIPNVGITNFPASQVVTIASGTSNINVGNFPTVQTVALNNLPIPLAVVITSGVPLTLSSTVISGTLSGDITADQGAPGTPWPMTIASGTSNINIGNFPTSQGVNVNNWPATQIVSNPSFTASGVQHTAVDNFPTVQSVAQSTIPWTIVNQPGSTIAISGTVIVGGGGFPTGTKLNTYENSFSSNGTTTVTASTSYISQITVVIPTGGTTSTVTIQDGNGQVLVDALSTTAVSTAPTIYNFQTPIKMTSGIQIVMAGAVSATANVWINYYQ